MGGEPKSALVLVMAAGRELAKRKSVSLHCLRRVKYLFGRDGIEVCTDDDEIIIVGLAHEKLRLPTKPIKLTRQFQPQWRTVLLYYLEYSVLVLVHPTFHDHREWYECNNNPASMLLYLPSICRLFANTILTQPSLVLNSPNVVITATGTTRSCSYGRCAQAGVAFRSRTTRYDTTRQGLKTRAIFTEKGPWPHQSPPEQEAGSVPSLSSRFGGYSTRSIAQTRALVANADLEYQQFKVSDAGRLGCIKSRLSTLDSPRSIRAWVGPGAKDRACPCAGVDRGALAGAIRAQGRV